MLISGGQTGVDRAALDFALQTGIPCSGWCPSGRRAEDGAIPAHFPMREASSAAYQHRTRLNVKDSDATLIFSDGCPSRGTALTIDCCYLLRKPFLVVSISDYKQNMPADQPAVTTATVEQNQPAALTLQQPEQISNGQILAWLQHVKPEILNIAGPRASECQFAAITVIALLEQLIEPSSAPKPVWPPARPFTPDLPS